MQRMQGITAAQMKLIADNVATRETMSDIYDKIKSNAEKGQYYVSFTCDELSQNQLNVLRSEGFTIEVIREDDQWASRANMVTGYIIDWEKPGLSKEGLTKL